MTIVAACPKCSKQYRVKDEFAGKRVKCSTPDCQTSFQVSAPIVIVEKKEPVVPTIVVSGPKSEQPPKKTGWNWSFLKGESEDVKIARIEAQAKVEAIKSPLHTL